MTDPPQVVNITNGPVLTTPKVQLIAYAEDTYLPDIEKQLTELTMTQTWAAQTAEYGVGPLTINPTITIPGTPPKTLDDNSGNVTPFEMTLAANLSGASPAWGAADQSTIYLFLLPSGTQVNSGGLCCDPNYGYFGYHYEAPVGSSSVAYAVVCNCPGFASPPLTALDDLTTTVTHELAEAATNPFVQLGAGVPAGGRRARHLGGGHLRRRGRRHVPEQHRLQLHAAGIHLHGAAELVQRGRQGRDEPLRPGALHRPLLQQLPDAPGHGDPRGRLLVARGDRRGRQIPIGQTKTIDVVLHGDGTTSGPWKVDVQDLSYYSGDTTKPVTQLSLDKTSGSEGDVLHLTIKVLKADASLGGEGFVLTSTLGMQQNIWYAAIGQ